MEYIAKMDTINFGVWGVGRIGRQHAEIFACRDKEYKLVALCDRSKGALEQTAAKFGGTPYHESAAFLADPAVDLVIIATRSLDHVRHATEALAAGKRVLLEKPIAVTTTDYEQMQQLVARYPEQLYFGHNHRFEPAFMNAREIVASGILGSVYLVKIRKHHNFMRRSDWQMQLEHGGGQLSVWGPHIIDQGLQWLGAPVRKVESYLRRILTPCDGDDHVKITLFGKNEVVAELEIGNAFAVTEPYCAIYGDRGVLYYGQKQKEIVLKYLAPEFQWPAAEEAVVGDGPAGAMHSDPVLPWIEERRIVVPETSMWVQVEIELAARLYAALKGITPFPVTSEQALEVVRISEIVKEQNQEFNWAE